MLALGSGLGLVTTAQLLPFQCSVNVPMIVPVASVWRPTAQASPGASATTPRSSALPPPLALATTVQLVPFQCSVSGCAALPVPAVPTAQTSALPVALAAFSTLLPVPALGLATSCQALPVQCSIKVWRAAP